MRQEPVRPSIFCLLPVLALAGCFPAARPGTNVPGVPPPPAKFVPPSLPRSEIVVSPPQLAQREISGIEFEGIRFDSRSHRLLVADQRNGPGSQFADAASAARSLGGLAAANAGFFTPEGAPLGRVISRGNSAGSWNFASSLGSGIWYETAGGQSAIVRRSSPIDGAEMIQAGPLLVENGRAVGGLDSSKASVRTMILWDGGSRWWWAGPRPARSRRSATPW